MGRLFLYLIGIFYVILGALSVFATDMAKKKFFDKLLKIKDFKKFSAIPIALGALILLSASASRFRVFMVIFGVLGVLKGVWMLTATEHCKKICDWWLKASNNLYKIWGVFIIILGSIILVGLK